MIEHVQDPTTAASRRRSVGARFAPVGKAAAVAALLAVPPVAHLLSGDTNAGAYQHPVDAEVSARFDAPAHAFGPGNRGQEYRVDPGEPVRAVEAGVVVFSGWVAGQQYLTVLHPDGRRSSYSPVASRSVSAGARVAAGQVIGRTAGEFQLGIRQGDTYLDPALFIDDAVTHAVLLQ